MIIHEMTWPELREIDFSGIVVLVPVGSTEQHGPHLPVDTDTKLVSRLAEEVERRAAGAVLLTPTMWLGHSPHHLSFGGTLSIDYSAYAAMLQSVCRSYIGMGARAIWILNGHGGNHAPISAALQSLKLEHPDVKAMAAEYWQMAAAEIGSIRESGPGGMGHACELETSLYMYIDETKVRKQMIRDDGRQPEGSMIKLDMLGGNAVSQVFNFSELTASGVFGQPTLASAEKGRLLFAAIADKLTNFVRETVQAMKGEASDG